MLSPEELIAGATPAAAGVAGGSPAVVGGAPVPGGAVGGAPTAAGSALPTPEAVGGAQQARQPMRWTAVMSNSVLRCFCHLISTGVRTDKGFKEVHLNKVARDLKEFTGNDVTGTQVYNHLRKWRQRWIRVTKLRELSGALFDEDNYMVTLEEHYKGHVNVN